MRMLVNIMAATLNQFDECANYYRGNNDINSDIKSHVRSIRHAINDMSALIDDMGDKGLT
jgi:hypothetical protein